jgi:hypothetical protein
VGVESREPAHLARGVEEVGEDDRGAAPVDGGEDPLEVDDVGGRALAGDLAQPREERLGAPGVAEDLDRPLGEAREPRERHRVAAAQRDVADRAREPAGLVALAAGHGEAAVDAEEDGHRVLGLEALDDGLAEAEPDVPVDVAQVVAGDVRAVVGELAAGPDAARGTLAGRLAAQAPAGEDREPVEAAQVARGEERLGHRPPVVLRSASR